LTAPLEIILFFNRNINFPVKRFWKGRGGAA
jgi:hypothetical protein